MTVQNITDYENFSDAVSPDDLPPPPPPAAFLPRNQIDQVGVRPVAVAMSQRNANPPSLPTSPVRVPAAPTSLSSPTDSYDSSALGKVCLQLLWNKCFKILTLH